MGAMNQIIDVLTCDNEIPQTRLVNFMITYENIFVSIITALSVSINMQNIMYYTMKVYISTL